MSSAPFTGRELRLGYVDMGKQILRVPYYAQLIVWRLGSSKVRELSQGRVILEKA